MKHLGNSRVYSDWSGLGNLISFSPITVVWPMEYIYSPGLDHITMFANKVNLRLADQHHPNHMKGKSKRDYSPRENHACILQR